MNSSRDGNFSVSPLAGSVIVSTLPWNSNPAEFVFELEIAELYRVLTCDAGFDVGEACVGLGLFCSATFDYEIFFLFGLGLGLVPPFLRADGFGHGTTVSFPSLLPSLMKLLRRAFTFTELVTASVHREGVFFYCSKLSSILSLLDLRSKISARDAMPPPRGLFDEVTLFWLALLFKVELLLTLCTEQPRNLQTTLVALLAALLTLLALGARGALLFPLPVDAISNSRVWSGRQHHVARTVAAVTHRRHDTAYPASCRVAL